MAKVKKKPASKKRSGGKPVKKKAVAKRIPSKRKSKKVSAIPKGYNSITPYLIMDGASRAIEFYKKAFGAKEKMRMQHADGKIGHAELQIGDTKIMLADECSEMHAYGPQRVGGSPISIHLYIKNVDEVLKKAVSLGAKIIRPIENMFYGDRSVFIEDPAGHKWCISTHIEDVTAAKMKKRAAEFLNSKK